MNRGEYKLFIWSPVAVAIRRSSDGLWAWTENSPVLPWFAYKSRGLGKLSVVLGEYMFFFCWTGLWPLKIPALKFLCWLTRGKYVMVNRDTGEKV